MPTTFDIRPAQRSDASVLVSLITELAAYESLQHQLAVTSASLEAELFGPSPVAEAALAWQGAIPAGFALWFHNYSTFLGRRGLYLEDLFIRPAFRRQGCGKALLRHVATQAVARGCGRFEWTVLDWNESAIRFYRSVGADVLPDWRVCRVTGDALRHLATE